MKFFVLLAFTLFLRVLFEVNNPLLTSDHSFQIEVTKNFIQSGNFTNAWVESEDLSKIHFEPLKLWPVGLSIIIYLLNFFTNNLVHAVILFQCIGSVLFVLGILKILKLFNVSSHIVNLFLLLFAFNSAPFIYLGSTDLFTASLFIWIVYFAIIELISDSVSILNVIYITMLSFFAAILRFACIPNLVIVPFVFAIAWVISQDNRKLLSAFFILLFSCFFTVIFYKFFPFSSVRTGFIDNIKNGTFYFSHLKWFDPFTLKGFFFTSPIEWRLPHNPIILFLYRLVLLLSSIVFLFYIISIFIKKLNIITWIKNQYKKRLTMDNSFILLFIGSFLVITSFIALQSLTTLPESNSFGPSWMPPFWTFVYNTRYFIYLIAMLIILFFVAYHKQRNKHKGKGVEFKITYYLALTWAIIYWSYLQYHYYSENGKGGGSQWTSEANNIETFNIINNYHYLEPNTHIVFAHYKKVRRMGLITNYAYAYPTDCYYDIIAGKYTNSSKLTLIMAMPNNLSNNEIVFLEKHEHKILKTFESEKLIKINL